MNLEEGEKILGIIEKIKNEGCLISLKGNKTGFASENKFNGIDKQDLEQGKRVYVKIKGKNSDGNIDLSVEGIVNEKKYRQNIPKSIKEETVKSIKRKYNGSPKNEVKEELNKWFKKVDSSLKKLEENRSKRLNKDYF